MKCKSVVVFAFGMLLGFLALTVGCGDHSSGRKGAASDANNAVPPDDSRPTETIGKDGAVATTEQLRIVSIAGGMSHSCAVVNDGARCWGRNRDGTLGDGTTTDREIPVQVLGLTSGVTAIAAASHHTCAAVDGGVRCWGLNGAGSLGDGTVTDSLVSVKVSGLTSGVTAITTGLSHTCAVVNGGAQCWGDNSSGELGDRTTDYSSIPVQVSGLTLNVTAIAAGNSHTCALVDGGIQFWGDNMVGQFGDGIRPSSSVRLNSSVPVQVPGLTSNVTGIAAGTGKTCAVVDGGAKCWGNDDFGDVPHQVSGLTSNVTAITIGAEHKCAVVNGGVKCWGDNHYGQLGDGTTTTNSDVPVQVLGLTSNVVAVSAWGYHTCALANGGVKCWGANTYGQLGNGTTKDSNVPVDVLFP